MARTPKLGGELPAYNTMGVTKLKRMRRPTIDISVTTPPLKGKSRTPKPITLSPAERARIAEMNANRTAVKKDLALPPLKMTMTAKPRMPAPRIMSTGEPSSSKYVQRALRENIGMPGTSKFVQRMPGGAYQRKPSAAGVGMGRVLGTLRTKLSAPRKPAK